MITTVQTRPHVTLNVMLQQLCSEICASASPSAVYLDRTVPLCSVRSHLLCTLTVWYHSMVWGVICCVPWLYGTTLWCEESSAVYPDCMVPLYGVRSHLLCSLTVWYHSMMWGVICCVPWLYGTTLWCEESGFSASLAPEQKGALCRAQPLVALCWSARNYRLHPGYGVPYVP